VDDFAFDFAGKFDLRVCRNIFVPVGSREWVVMQLTGDYRRAQQQVKKELCLLRVREKLSNRNVVLNCAFVQCEAKQTTKIPQEISCSR
jgi:hypothetical protein